MKQERLASLINRIGSESQESPWQVSLPLPCPFGLREGASKADATKLELN